MFINFIANRSDTTSPKWFQSRPITITQILVSPHKNNFQLEVYLKIDVATGKKSKKLNRVICRRS